MAPGSGDGVRPASVFAAARTCLAASTVEAKLACTSAAAAAFFRGELAVDHAETVVEPIAAPGRPPRPRLVHPRDLPQRGLGTSDGRAAFVHAIAHIEFNAIDLAWDAVYRFRGMPDAYYADWVRIADDEARHFAMLQARLQATGHGYGDFDAHNGLWEMAEKTAHDCLARMALVPRVLEARGLDVTPAMIVKLRALGDHATADVLGIILGEEIAHVAAGSHWFRWCCVRAGVDAERRFRELLVDYAHGVLRGPFNLDARSAAGFGPDELAALQQLAR